MKSLKFMRKLAALKPILRELNFGVLGDTLFREWERKNRI